MGPMMATAAFRPNRNIDGMHVNARYRQVTVTTDGPLRGGALALSLVTYRQMTGSVLCISGASTGGKN